MYNRYIPQADGSFQRSRIPERPPSTPPPSPPRYTAPAPQSQPVPVTGVTSFLRRLLPKEFDTADLFIVLLLLLMAGDNEKEKNSAILTLALYFIL